MRKIYFSHRGQNYLAIVRDDHPALVYRCESKGGCREDCTNLVASVYPFHAESQPEKVMVATVCNHLDSLSLGADR